jgi:hypothetical protein
VARSLGPAGYRKFAAQGGSDVGVGLLLSFRLRLSAFGPERPALVRPVTRVEPTDSDRSTLVVSCLDNGGKVSKRGREQFAGRVPENVFDDLEEVAREALLLATEAAPDSGPH